MESTLGWVYNKILSRKGSSIFFNPQLGEQLNIISNLKQHSSGKLGKKNEQRSVVCACPTRHRGSNFLIKPQWSCQVSMAVWRSVIQKTMGLQFCSHRHFFQRSGDESDLVSWTRVSIPLLKMLEKILLPNGEKFRSIFSFNAHWDTLWVRDPIATSSLLKLDACGRIMRHDERKLTKKGWLRCPGRGTGKWMKIDEWSWRLAGPLSLETAHLKQQKPILKPKSAREGRAKSVPVPKHPTSSRPLQRWRFGRPLHFAVAHRSALRRNPSLEALGARIHTDSAQNPTALTWRSRLGAWTVRGLTRSAFQTGIWI